MLLEDVHFLLNELPFEGRTDLSSFIGEDGFEYFCSADGEHYYNAKGQKLKGFLKKAGKKTIQAGKWIGKQAKKVGRFVVKASKNVANNVKKVGKNVKTKGHNLIHHKAKDSASNGNDIFTKALEPIKESDISKLSPEKIIEVAGKKYSTLDADGKEIVETTDASGNAIAGIEYKPEEVVAVDGADGNIDYKLPESKGMSKGLKIGLIVGGSLLVVGLIAFAIYKSKKK